MKNAQVERKHAGLSDAIADGLRSAGWREKLEGLESRKAELTVEIEQGALTATAPVFQGKLAEAYRARVAGLRDATQKIPHRRIGRHYALWLRGWRSILQGMVSQNLGTS